MGRNQETMTDDSGLYADGRLWKAERRGSTMRAVAISYIRNCIGGRAPEEEK